MNAICNILKTTAGSWEIKIPDAAAACCGV